MNFKKNILLTTLLVLYTITVYSQGDQEVLIQEQPQINEMEALIPNTTIPNGFYTFKLENGLEVYVQEDYTIPTMRIEYISKAGTGRQTKETTGFYQLYSRLFWKNSFSGTESYEKIGAGEFNAQSGYSQSRYSFIVPATQFSQGLTLFSNDLKNSRFLDKDIEREFSQLKQEVSAWSASIPGFINASVDAKLFSQKPWTKDSGIYPALFSKNTIEEVRYELSRISNTWYVPDQSALFINGPLNAQTVLELVKQEFSSWESSYIVGSASDSRRTTPSVSSQNDESNIFVLVSNDFSKDYIQAVIQYTSPGLGASNEFSANSWASAQMMETKLQNAGMTNTNTAFVADAGDSRIIIQTLFDTQSLSENSDLAVMVPSFVNIVKSTASTFTQQDLQTAKNRAILLQNNAVTGSESFMDAIAVNWAYGGVEYFFQWTQAVQDVQLENTKQSFNEPWIFVLLHSDLYAKNKESFTNLNYIEITRDTGMWYNEYEQQFVSQENTPTILPSQSIDRYAQYTKSLIKNFTISSNIPITTQEIPLTPWVSVLVNIDGGHVLHGESQRGMEDVSINYLKKEFESTFIDLYTSGKIKALPEIESTIGMYSSHIGIVCLSEDLHFIIEAMSYNIKNIEIPVASADELFLSTSYNWRIQSGSLEYQLYAAAMETLFAGSETDGLYNANTEYFRETNYNSIRLATQQLYDPARFSFVVSGEIPNDIENIFEHNFGTTNFYPQVLGQRATLIEEQEPIFSPLEQTVRLRHTFLTDIPSELAGERPTKLIPTTDFSDPAQLYFKFPVYEEENQSIFIALLYEVASRISHSFENTRSPPAQSVSLVPGTGKYPVSSLRFAKVKSRTALEKLVNDTFDEVLNDLDKELQNSNEDNEVLTTIKSRYTRILSREMIRINDRSHLIQQGINATKNPSLYLERFEIVEKSTSQDFYDVFNSFIKTGEFYWVFSADTNR